MIFVDGSVLQSVVGEAGAERAHAQAFFLRSLDLGIPIVTSAAALFEATVSFGEHGELRRTDGLMDLVRGRMAEIWPLEAEDFFHAQNLRYRFPHLHEAALIKLAACERRGVGGIQTFDGALRHASHQGSRGTRLTGRDRARPYRLAYAEKRRREGAEREGGVLPDPYFFEREPSEPREPPGSS